MTGREHSVPHGQVFACHDFKVVVVIRICEFYDGAGTNNAYIVGHAITDQSQAVGFSRSVFNVPIAVRSIVGFDFLSFIGSYHFRTYTK